MKERLRDFLKGLTNLGMNITGCKRRRNRCANLKRPHELRDEHNGAEEAKELVRNFLKEPHESSG